MAATPPDDSQQIKRFIQEAESDVLDFCKALKAKPYSLASIKRKLARRLPADDPLASRFADVEGKLLLLARVFDLDINYGDTRPFFGFLRRTLNPPRQTLITDWLDRLVDLNHGDKPK
ncbi:MAG: hypothetical protein JW839_11650 [Candidatus Lokiarchaeota archaeon]|nr:hypothetical protein [Candidatus Lokiarchaeota archaeon]